MKIVSVTTESSEDLPKFDFTNHDWFYSFQISGKSPDPRLSFFIKDLKDVIAIKNSILSAFNKAMREAGYGS